MVWEQTPLYTNNIGVMNMERVIDVAQFVYDEYKNISKSTIDEMKLHKILYLSQREAIAITNVPLFDASFEGWKYGPVCRAIRSSFTVDGFAEPTKPLAFDSAYIVRNVLAQYAHIESWKLSELTHGETSWKNSRVGLSKDENGTVELKIDDIRFDALKVRPYDSVWDMYYDEFDDSESPAV